MALVCFTGCTSPKPHQSVEISGPAESESPPTAATPAPKQKPATLPAAALLIPDPSLSGKVSRFNEAGRFVVLEFPIAHMPVVGQRLFVYRDGLRVGELKVTGPHRDDHTVADLTAGETRAGDEVREN